MENEPLAQAPRDDSTDTEVPEARKKLVEQWNKRVVDARSYWEEKGLYKQVKSNMQFAARGASKEWVEGGNYVVPILNRHINQAVSRLYAKNPTGAVKRKKRLHYKLWDGRSDSLQAAMEMAAVGDPNAMMLIQEVTAARQYDLMLDRMAQTLEALWEYYVNEQAANFKQQLKAAVRRAKVCKVAYIKLGFQRLFEKRPEITAQIEDVTSKIASMEAVLQEFAEGEIEENDPKIEQLRVNLADLQQQEDLLVREGVIFDFPRVTEVTIDPKCRHLKSLAGAEWVSHDFDMTPEMVEETYGKDICGKFTEYKADGNVWDGKGEKPGNTVARVHEIQDKKNRIYFTICEGFDDYLEEPTSNKLKIERFFNIFPIVFNETEEEDNIFPPSDIELGKDIQEEYNRSRQGLREHRIAARPYWVEGHGLEDTEKTKLANHAAHEVISMKTLGTNQKIEDLLQAGPTASIDPNLYETEMHWSDLMRCLGGQEAQYGATSDSTATEASIAENSSSVASADNVDDLDEVLTEVARSVGQIMLTELSKETVIEIVGEGAVWPDYPQTRAEVAKDLELEIEAGSSGRPNQAAELAKLERAGPFLIQLPGVNPAPITRRYAKLLDLDMDEMVAEDLPSIQAMNAILAKQAAGQTTGNPETDPNMQGGEGAQNAQGPQQNEGEPGPQPAYTAPEAPVA